MPCNRAQSTNPIVIDRWFDGLKIVYDLHNFHEKPCHVFNCDESGYQCNQGRFKCICRRGSKVPSKLAASNEKTTYTILACCSASGVFMPLHTVYKGVKIMSAWTRHGPANATYDVSESGWMEGENFYKWFVECFIPHVFLDGHASHITLKLIDKAIENNIVLYKLAAHTSHLYQPLDVAVFGPAKTAWRQAIDTHCKANGFKDIAKHAFPGLMKQVVAKAFTSQNARSGFEASGLWPLNRERIANEKLQVGSIFGFSAGSKTLEPNALEEYEQEM